jgi:hypothetical protein
MDFTGATPMQAGSRLIAFVKRIADQNGDIVQTEPHGVLGSSEGAKLYVSNASGKTFYLEADSYTDDYVAVVKKINPSEKTFGGGRITKRGAMVMLELHCEKGTTYRWYGAPVLLDDNVRKVIPTPDGRPFPLTVDYVSDGLAALHE